MKKIPPKMHKKIQNKMLEIAKLVKDVQSLIIECPDNNEMMFLHDRYCDSFSNFCKYMHDRQRDEAN